MTYQTKAIALLLQAAIAFTSAITAKPAEWQTFPAKVVSVHDGDTLTVEAKASDGTLYQYKVRLLYIDAPELKQPGGIEARDHLRHLVNKSVNVKWQERDRYGRVLGDVFTTATPTEMGLMVNHSMVVSGNAWFYKEYPPKELSEKVWYSTGEGEAKRSGEGLWSKPNPIPPWEFRKLQKVK